MGNKIQMNRDLLLPLVDDFRSVPESNIGSLAGQFGNEAIENDEMPAITHYCQTMSSMIDLLERYYGIALKDAQRIEDLANNLTTVDQHS